MCSNVKGNIIPYRDVSIYLQDSEYRVEEAFLSCIIVPIYLIPGVIQGPEKFGGRSYEKN